MLVKWANTIVKRKHFKFRNEWVFSLLRVHSIRWRGPFKHVYTSKCGFSRPYWWSRSWYDVVSVCRLSVCRL